MEMRQILTHWIESYEELEKSYKSLSEDLQHMRLERDNLRELIVELKSHVPQREAPVGVSEPTMIANLELLKNYDRRVKELTNQLSVYQSRKVSKSFPRREAPEGFSESPHSGHHKVTNQGTQTDEMSVLVETADTTIPPHVPPRISLNDLGDFLEGVFTEINGVFYTVLDHEPPYIFSMLENEELGDCVGYYYQGKPFFYDSL